MSKPTRRELYDLEPSFADVVQIEIDGELESYVAERYENGNTAQRSLGFAREAAERVVESIESTQDY
jgi:hypothetical protein